MRRALPLLACALLIAVGCGGNQTSKSARGATKPAPPPAEVQSRIVSAYNGPKIRVAVGKFKDLEAAQPLFEELGWTGGIAPTLTNQITTGLVQSGRVAVLERAQLGKVIGNLALENESRLSRYFDQETTADTGKLLGAQAVLVGAVTQFEPNVSTGGGGISIPMLGGLSYHQDKAVVGIDVRLVNQETGKVLVAASGSAEVVAKEGGGGLSYGGLEIGGEAFTRTPLGEATRNAAQKAISDLVKGLQQTPWEGKILSSKVPDKVFISAGSDLNLQKGDRFRVIHRGDAITGPDGSILGYDETEGGQVELTVIQPKMSIGKVLEGAKLPKKDDIVRLEL